MSLKTIALIIPDGYLKGTISILYEACKVLLLNRQSRQTEMFVDRILKRLVICYGAFCDPESKEIFFAYKCYHISINANNFVREYEGSL